MADFVTCPFTIVIDSREQAPYLFTGFRTPKSQGAKPILVNTVVKALASGDYSIEGLEHEISVERKSKEDLFGTLGSGRERFEREFMRLNVMNFAGLVIESTEPEIHRRPPEFSRLLPNTISGTEVAWSQRYRNVHWYWVGSRIGGEMKTYKILERYWKDRADRMVNQ